MFTVIAPPAEINALLKQGMTLAKASEAAGEQLAEAAKPIWQAAKDLGLTLDVPGFLYAWLSGTRVLAEKDGDRIVGLAFMAVGKKWVSDDTSATIIETAGENASGMLEFAKTIAAALGATTLYATAGEQVLENGNKEYRVLAYRV